MTVNVDQVPIQWSALLEKLRAGEVVIIADAGGPVARLVPTESSPPQRRVPGSAKGQFRIADGFNDPLPEDMLREFENDLPA